MLMWKKLRLKEEKDPNNHQKKEVSQPPFYTMNPTISGISHVSEQHSAKWTIQSCSLLSSEKSMRKFGIANGREGGGCGRLSPLLCAPPPTL